MPKKLERCVKKVKEQNKKKPKSKQVNPYAVCQKSTKQKPHKKKGKKK